MEQGTPIEKKLARRIHNQRVRLRQLEEIKSWHIEARSFHQSIWFKMATKLMQDNMKLRGQLGIRGQFDQKKALQE